MRNHGPSTPSIRRRRFLLGGLAFFAAWLAAPLAFATPKAARKKLAELTGVDKPEKGRVTLIVPKTTDAGPLVPVTIRVESPMTDADHVKAVHIVAERNTVPEVATFHFSPRNRRAEVSTRIRLRKTQTIVAAAQMSDGSVFVGKARCKILGAGGGCG